MKYRKSNRWSQHAHIIVHPTTLIIVAATAIVLFLMSPNAADKLATVSISVPEAGTSVFFDNKKERITEQDNEVVVIDKVTAGAHLALTHKDGNWPWSKAIQVEASDSIALAPFGISQTPSLASIPQFSDPLGINTNPQYESILEHFAGQILGKAKTSPSRTTEIKKDSLGTNLLAVWKGDKESQPSYFCEDRKCNDPLVVLPQDREVRDMDFYPGRDDLILFSAENRIYVIELDNRDIQNIQPLYESLLGEPSFVRTIDGGVYVLDGDDLYLITL